MKTDVLWALWQKKMEKKLNKRTTLFFSHWQQVQTEYSVCYGVYDMMLYHTVPGFWKFHTLIRMSYQVLFWAF